MSGTTKDNDQHDDGGDMISSKNECTSCEQNNVDNITEGIGSVALLDDTSTCANCGKEGNSDDMNNCNKCKMVKYCNAACKKKHRTKHKKACERRAAELHEEALFKEVEPEECPICFLPLQCGNETETFKSCCGKVICSGCIYAMKMSDGKDLCPYCRAPPPTSDEERIKRIKKLMDSDNARAFYNLAGYYARGVLGMPQDYQKANELYLKAGELGSAEAYYNLGNSYVNGDGVEVDTKKAQHYYELAAIMGDLDARYNLGRDEHRAGNHDRAMKHFIIAARAGEKDSLYVTKEMLMQGIITKNEYASTLRTHHERQKEIKSVMREKAAAAQSQI